MNYYNTLLYGLRMLYVVEEYIWKSKNKAKVSNLAIVHMAKEVWIFLKWKQSINTYLGMIQSFKK